MKFTRVIRESGKNACPGECHADIPFEGWTRTVSVHTVREALQKLKLYGQFLSYQDFLNGADPMYELVDDFKEPLRRLKDE